MPLARSEIGTKIRALPKDTSGYEVSRVQGVSKRKSGICAQQGK